MGEPMTIEQMNRVTKEQISRLHPLTKREFIAHANNQLAAITGHADNIAAGRGDSIEAALAIARTARKWHAELEQIFGERTQESEPATTAQGSYPDGGCMHTREQKCERCRTTNPDAHLGASGPRHEA